MKDQAKVLKVSLACILLHILDLMYTPVRLLAPESKLSKNIQELENALVKVIEYQ